MNTRELRVERTAKGYVVHHLLGNRPDQNVITYFGTHILPTPFTALSDFDGVLAKIRKLNPDCIVSRW